MLISEPQAFEVEASGRGRSRGSVEQFGSQEALGFQQIAISNCLGWIVERVTTGVYGSLCRFSQEDPTPSQYLFAKALLRISDDGQPWHDDPKHAYERRKRDLEGFMERNSGTDNTDVPIAKRNYHRYVAGLATEVCATQ
ncbi:MAG: hypothetical protein KA748_08965 [Halomonas sp.]|nr:hypothetical protein [Halomonas sp.]MBP5980325.1 hypothetical protein [Halomonas sp.]